MLGVVSTVGRNYRGMRHVHVFYFNTWLDGYRYEDRIVTTWDFHTKIVNSHDRRIGGMVRKALARRFG